MSTRWALFLALAFALLRCAYAGQIDLAPDEAYYWEWSRSLDWSYYEQGPVLAFAIRLGTALFGHTELGVRFMAIMSGLGASVLALWLCVKLLDAKSLGLWVVLAFNTMLLFSAGGVLMMHDSLLGFFWMAALAAMAWSAAPGGGAWAWLFGAACLALGLMSKYTGVLLFFCLALAAWVDPRLKSRRLWVALLLGACGGLPMLVWNWAHGWPSLTHTLSLAQPNPAFRVWRAMPAYVAAQLGLVSPLLFWLVLRGWSSAWRRFRSGSAAAVENLLLFSSAPVFLFFLLLSARTFVEGNWPAAAYLGGLVLAGLQLRREGKLPSSFSRWALGISAAFSLLAHVQAAWPFLPFPQSMAKLDTVSRVDGWRELGARVYLERMRMDPSTSSEPSGSPQDPSTSSGPSARPKAFTGCMTYQNAAELAFYQPGQERCLILRDGGVNQYRFWNDPQAKAGQDAILAFAKDQELSDMARYFKKIEPLEDEVFIRNHIEIRRVRLARAYGFDAAAFAKAGSVAGQRL